MRPVVVDLLHVLRGGGIPNPMAALEQLSFLLLLLYLGPEPWERLVRCPSKDRIAMLRKELFPGVLRRPSVGGLALREAMRDATFAFPSSELLDLVVQRLVKLSLDEYTCADLLDAALDEVSATSSVGSPRTPPAVSACMISLTDPRLGDSVFDPAAGAGERLLSVTRRANMELDGSVLRVLGVDLDATIVRLGVMSLVFHGIDAPDIYTRNVLVDPPDSTELFDFILCQPPFGNRIDPSMLAPEFRDLRGTRSEVLFAELTLNRLTKNGRAVIVLPASVAFSNGPGFRRLRRRLLERLRAVVRLPQGMFHPHTNAETFMVALGPSTNDVVFLDASDSERGQTEQSMEILRHSGAIVTELLDRGLPVGEIYPEERRRVLVVGKDRIRENDYSLLTSSYGPQGETSSVTDSPLELFREIEQAETEITRRLEELGRRLVERSSRND